MQDFLWKIIQLDQQHEQPTPTQPCVPAGLVAYSPESDLLPWSSLMVIFSCQHLKIFAYINIRWLINLIAKSRNHDTSFIFTRFQLVMNLSEVRTVSEGEDRRFCYWNNREIAISIRYTLRCEVQVILYQRFRFMHINTYTAEAEAVRSLTNRATLFLSSKQGCINCCQAKQKYSYVQIRNFVYIFIIIKDAASKFCTEIN